MKLLWNTSTTNHISAYTCCSTDLPVLLHRQTTAVSKLISTTTDILQLLRVGASSNQTQLCWPLHCRDKSGFTVKHIRKKMKSQEKRCLNRAYWNSKTKCWVVCVCSSLSQERRKKSHSLLSEDKNDHNTENQLPSHTYGAMERICILGAQEDKHRDRAKKQTVPTSLQTAHTPDSSLQHLRARLPL